MDDECVRAREREGREGRPDVDVAVAARAYVKFHIAAWSAVQACTGTATEFTPIDTHTRKNPFPSSFHARLNGGGISCNEK